MQGHHQGAGRQRGSENSRAGGIRRRKDATGRAVLKPLERVEAKVQPVIVAAVAMAVVLAFVVALVLRGSDLKSSVVILGLAR